MTNLDLPVMLGILRHILTAVGGILVGFGWMSTSDLEGWIGIVMAAVGVVWSVFDKIKKKDVGVVTPTPVKSLIFDEMPVLSEPTVDEFVAEEVPFVPNEPQVKEIVEPKIVKKTRSNIQSAR